MIAVFDKLSSNVRGILFMVAATMFLTSMSSMVRSLTDDINAFEIAFFRNFFGFLMLTPVLIRQGLVILETRDLGLMAVRGAFNATAMVMYFMAISIMPLAEVAALNFTVPLFVVIMAVLILKEKIGPARIATLVIGFSGALLILRPGFSVINPGAFLALGSSATWAVAVIVIKHISRRNSSLTITLYATIFLGLFTFIPSLFFWSWPTVSQYALLAGIALAGTFGQICFTESLKSADASLVMPFDFTKLIWASLFGYFLFDQVPTVWTFVGGSIIFGSATYITYRERNKAPSGAAKPEAPTLSVPEPAAAPALSAGPETKPVAANGEEPSRN